MPRIDAAELELNKLTTTTTTHYVDWKQCFYCMEQTQTHSPLLLWQCLVDSSRFHTHKPAKQRMRMDARHNEQVSAQTQTRSQRSAHRKILLSINKIFVFIKINCQEIREQLLDSSVDGVICQNGDTIGSVTGIPRNANAWDSHILQPPAYQITSYGDRGQSAIGRCLGSHKLESQEMVSRISSKYITKYI